MRLRGTLNVLRRALASWGSGEAPCEQQIFFFRRAIADVRSNARRTVPPAETATSERRRDARAMVSAPVSFSPWDPARTCTGFTRNVSKGGALVFTRTPLPPGTSLAVRLLPPGWEVEAMLAGVVERASAHEMAIRFLGSGVGQGPEAIQAIMAAGRGMPLGFPRT
jgi:hypothetical protein